MISPFCPKCRAVILPGRGECPDCKEPVRDRPGVTDSLRRVEAPSTRGDLFCPSCHGLILSGDTRCAKCGMILKRSPEALQAQGASRQDFSQKSGENPLGRTELAELGLPSMEHDLLDVDQHSLPGDDKKRWKTYLEPSLKDLEAEFHYVISHELVLSCPDLQKLANATRLIFLKPTMSFGGLVPEEINAYATKGEGSYFVIYPSGMAICDRLIAGILSAADLSLTGEARMPLEEILTQLFTSISPNGRMTSNRAVSILDKKLFHLLDEAQLSRAKDLSALICRWTIAHEVGHIIRGHCDIPASLRTPDVRRNNERDADHFAHNINNLSAFPEIAFLGGLVNNLLMIAGEGHRATQDSHTHPAPMERLENLFKNIESFQAFHARFNMSKESIFNVAKRIKM